MARTDYDQDHDTVYIRLHAMFLSVVHERVVETIERHKGRFISAGADPKVSSDAYHRPVRTLVFVDKRGRPTKSDRPTWDFDRVTGAGQPVSVGQLFREVAGAQKSFEYDVLYGALGGDIVHASDGWPANVPTAPNTQH